MRIGNSEVPPDDGNSCFELFFVQTAQGTFSCTLPGQLRMLILVSFCILDWLVPGILRNSSLTDCWQCVSTTMGGYATLASVMPVEKEGLRSVSWLSDAFIKILYWYCVRKLFSTNRFSTASEYQIGLTIGLTIGPTKGLTIRLLSDARRTLCNLLAQTCFAGATGEQRFGGSVLLNLTLLLREAELLPDP